MNMTKRTAGIIGRACAAAVIGTGSLLAVAGPASAATVAPAAVVAPAAAQAPAGDPCGPSGGKYTVTVGGTDGCEKPMSQNEKDCYKGAAVGGATGGATGGPGGALAGAAGGCAGRLVK